MQKLSPRQQQIYEYIRQYLQDNSYPPTIREIASAVGLQSPATVHAHVKKLKEQGLINISHSSQRTISLATEKKTPTTSVPRIGTVAAGQPILAFDDMSIYENIPLPKQMLHGAGEDQVFILDIKGESMIEAGILSGDMIVVHCGLAVHNGEIGVARIQGENATVKRVFYERDRIRLQPENSSMEPIYASRDNVEIIGKVIALLRQY